MKDWTNYTQRGHKLYFFLNWESATCDVLYAFGEVKNPALETRDFLLADFPLLN